MGGDAEHLEEGDGEHNWVVFVVNVPSCLHFSNLLNVEWSESQASQWSKTLEMHYKREEGGRGIAQ